MKVTFECPSCQFTGDTESDNIGKRARCPKCKTVFEVKDKEEANPQLMIVDDEPSQKRVNKGKLNALNISCFIVAAICFLVLVPAGKNMYQQNMKRVNEMQDKRAEELTNPDIPWSENEEKAKRIADVEQQAFSGRSWAIGSGVVGLLFTAAGLVFLIRR